MFSMTPHAVHQCETSKQTSKHVLLSLAVMVILFHVSKKHIQQICVLSCRCYKLHVLIMVYRLQENVL